MKLSYIYNQVVKLGSQRDVRRKDKINSYPDTAILYGDGQTQVNKVLIGIDIEASEILLSDRIRQREGLDLVISHHPEGRAYASLSEVMSLQIDMLKTAGVDGEIARKLLEERQQEVARRVLPQNHTRAVDAARLLNMPFMCIHTPADNHVSVFIEEFLKKHAPKTVQDVVDILLEIPEYKEASRINVGPKIILGNPNRKVGRFFMEMTGGTEGSKDAFDKLYRAGVRTLVSMHLSEEHLKKAREANLNAVIAGHVSSDTLGLNLLLDRLEKQAGERLETIDCSGFKRIRR